MLGNVDNLEKYFIYDEPVPYVGGVKKDEKVLLIKPAKINDYMDFHWYVNCLVLDKNSTPSPEIITMSYLRYIYYLGDNNAPYLYLTKMLLELVLEIESGEENALRFYTNENKAFFSVNGKEYNSQDFDNIKDIICRQNCIDPIDETIQKEIRDDMQNAEEYKMRQNSFKVCSLEEQMICLLVSTPLKLEDIYKLTIRKFSKILKRVDHKLHYEIYLSAKTSGMVTFSDPSFPKHWMNDLTATDKFSDVKIGMEEMQNKINMGKV